MFGGSMIFQNNILKKNIIHFSKRYFGNLYTWGKHSSGTSHLLHSENPETPVRCEFFNKNVEKVSMGPYHTAIITNSGDLYTLGYGKQGQLGCSDQSTTNEPQEVSFFKNKNLKVLDVICGDYHTIALASDNELYSWGYGGNYWIQQPGCIGNGNYDNHSQPQRITELKTTVKQITGGSQFVSVVNDKNQVINWGDGSTGVFGQTSKQFLQPTLNNVFELLREKEKLNVVSIKGCHNHQIALMSDGNLYALGRNLQGQLGVRNNIGITLDEEVDTPTQVVNQFFKGQQIKDFAVGQTTLVILTDQGKVYYAGLELAYKPIEFQLPKNTKVKLIAAAKDAVIVVSEENKIYSNYPICSDSKWNVKNQVYEVENTQFEKGDIKQIGGSYSIHYAIVQN